MLQWQYTKNRLYYKIIS